MRVLRIFKNHPKKMIFLCLLLLVQYLNFTGFCYSEGKYLTEEELIRKAAGRIYEENPDCCSVMEGGVYFRSYMDSFLNNFFGRHFYTLHKVYKQDSPFNPKEPYKNTYSTIDGCGAGYERYGESITEKQYNLLYNKKQKDQGDGNRN